jgi:alcohol dehydrogenase class IV
MAAPEAMARIARALDVTDAAQGLFDLAAGLGATMALRDLGMPEAGIDRATDLALANPYWNPQPLERNALRDLITAVWAGQRPAA